MVYGVFDSINSISNSDGLRARVIAHTTHLCAVKSALLSHSIDALDIFIVFGVNEQHLSALNKSTVMLHHALTRAITTELCFALK